MRTDEAVYFATDRSVIVLKFIDGLVALVRRYLAYRQRQAELAALVHMNERELKDFGLQDLGPQDLGPQDLGLYRFELDRLSRY